MFLAASGAIAIPAGLAAPLAHGLVLVAVPVVAQAVLSMALALCRDVLTTTIAIVALIPLLTPPAAWAQPAVIVGAGLLGAFLVRPSGEQTNLATPMRRGSLAPFALFLTLLVGLPLLVRIWPAPAIEVADSFYRTGSLVFGGGHVVLPLLEAETVGRGWLDRETFLAGYGAAQAVPGPLFSFAAFLGASNMGLPQVAGAFIALIALFLPGALLVLAGLSWWDRLKSRSRAAGFVRGAGAAVVGVLAAALWNPVIVSGIGHPADAVIAMAGFSALHFLRTPSWIVVVLTAIAGAFSAAWL